MEGTSPGYGLKLRFRERRGLLVAWALAKHRDGDATKSLDPLNLELPRFTLRYGSHADFSFYRRRSVSADCTSAPTTTAAVASNGAEACDTSAW
jgi:hypothetical protein